MKITKQSLIFKIYKYSSSSILIVKIFKGLINSIISYEHYVFEKLCWTKPILHFCLGFKFLYVPGCILSSIICDWTKLLGLLISFVSS